MEEEKSPKVASFQDGDSAVSLRQSAENAAVSDEESEDDIESRFVRDSFIDHTTGRRRQMLICRQCGLRTQKLCNMRDHIRCHMSRKKYRCSICKRGFVQSGNRDRHQAKAACIPYSIKDLYLNLN